MNQLNWLACLSVAIGLNVFMSAEAKASTRYETQQPLHSMLTFSPHLNPTLEFSNSLIKSEASSLQIGQSSPDASACPPPVLSQLTRHSVAAGETLEAIAQQYDLIPATLLGFNPSLPVGQLPVGSSVTVPPYNGIRVAVQPGTTWQALAERYGVRADVLFEINGCQPPANIAFIPGINWSPTLPSSAAASNPSAPSARLSRYPLPEVAEVLQDYGWQLQPTTGEVAFNSGVSLSAPTGTSVVAVEDGIVAFAGEQSGYGNLVVVNHDYGLQTRYAYLSAVEVTVGQQVQAGTVVGKSGQMGASAPASLLFEVRSNSQLGWIAQDPAEYIDNMRRFER